MSDLSDLLDKQAITEACYRYAIVLDNRDWPALATVFTPDAEAYYLDMPPCIGYQAIEDTCRAALSVLDASQHLIGNVTVTLDGDDPDSAESLCYLQAQHVKSGTEGGDNFIIAGRYLDRFVRTADGWRIKQRRLE
ncbi:MAG TPA: nuclear transport factor 2 family protein, partial [Jatrophihabitans sp.]|nr:nuclear transport factor 2 family protein [Jatrophihabitans sp.]